MTSLSQASIKANGETTLSTSRTAEYVEERPDEKQHSHTLKNSPESNAPDPDLVGWDGDDDPKKPQNWSGKKKWQSAGLIAAMSFLT